MPPSLTKLNHRLARGVLYLSLLFLSSPVLSAEVTILTDPGNSRAEQLSSRLVTALRESGLQVGLQPTGTGNSDPTPGNQLWVTVGKRALSHHLLHHPNLPAVALMVTEHQYRSVVGSHGKSGEITALFSDPPLQRQIHLIQIAIPSVRTIGILGSAPPDLALENIPQSEMKVLYHQVTDGISRPLQTMLQQVDVLLSTADPTLYNRNNFRNILLSSYRRRVPMVCHTEAAVVSGCIAGSHSSQDDLLSQATELVVDILQNRGEQLPAPEHIETFSVSINPRVARSLGLHLKNPDQITRQLLQFEETMP